MSDDLRSSTAAGVEVTLEVHNLRTFPTQLYWLDYEGRAVPYGVVEPDSKLQQSTFSTHAWRVCDERSGVAVAEYVGPSATLTLQADGSLKVEVGNRSPPAEPAAAAEAGGTEEAEGGEEGEEAEVQGA